MKFVNCTLVFLRHGKTAKNEVDRLRELTELGVDQAYDFRKKNPIAYDFAFSSPVIRAKKTTGIAIAANPENPEEIWGVDFLDILYELPDKDQNDALIKMGEKYGYSSLRDYIQLEGANALPMHKIGIDGALAMEKIMGKNVEEKCILVVAHAVTINSLIYWMFQGSEEVKNLALDTCLGECQAIKVLTGRTGEVIGTAII